MIRYAIAWQPGTDNLGDDLRVLAASRLLPRVDLALDIDRLDEPAPDCSGDDRVVTLLSGPMLQRSAHWPPEEHISPACVGIHFSEEDAWGLRFVELDGTGRAYLEQCAPIGCRDHRTMRLMEALNIPHELTACLTLTLDRPDVAESEPYICCVDVPDSATHALEEFAPGVGMSVRKMTHRLDNPERDYFSRMRHAEETLRIYAGAQFVVTRRLHCAMACLAVGTPVIMLYNNSYEDLSRFAPMDGMMHIRPVEEFVEGVEMNGFPIRWENPPGVEAWRSLLRESVQEAVAEAEKRPLPILAEQEAVAWREARLRKIVDVGEEKLLHLEQERYEALHEKLSLIMKEDALKTFMAALLKEPEMVRALQRIDARHYRTVRRNSLRRMVQDKPWYTRFLARFTMLQEVEPTGRQQKLEEMLKELGWPEQ